jgi:hypothetical protein
MDPATRDSTLSADAEQIKIEKEKIINSLQTMRDYLLAKTNTASVIKNILTSPVNNTENGK